MSEIAIVGGGPSGAMCGEQLALAGNTVHIFDEHLAWEKPCGGGLTYKATQRFPFLLDNPHPKKLIRDVEIISAENQRVKLDLQHPIVIYSRTVLNGMLLDRAREAGCHIHHSRVQKVDTDREKPRYSVDDEWKTADFVVLAAGARNQYLPGIRALSKDELEITQGYFVPQTAEEIIIKFLPEFEGYIWSFPRADHLSLGICGSMAAHTSSELKTHLHQFAASEKMSTENAKFYSHVLPSPQESTFSNRAVIGRNWALCGDAAAWVDPLTGEGLFYAMRSGEFLGRALGGRVPGEICGAGEGFVFGGTGICVEDCAEILSRIVFGVGGDDTDGAVSAAECGVSAIDERFVLRNAGLHDVEAEGAGPSGGNVEPVCVERVEYRPASAS